VKVGKKVQGQEVGSKMVVIRHGRASRRAVNRIEKALESKVRQAGRKACREVEA
jgi:hypothetical protein